MLYVGYSNITVSRGKSINNMLYPVASQQDTAATFTTVMEVIYAHFLSISEARGTLPNQLGLSRHIRFSQRYQSASPALINFFAAKSHQLSQQKFATLHQSKPTNYPGPPHTSRPPSWSQQAFRGGHSVAIRNVRVSAASSHLVYTCMAIFPRIRLQDPLVYNTRTVVLCRFSKWHMRI